MLKLKLILTFICALSFTAQAQKPAQPAAKKDGPAISFEKEEYDFGKIEKGNVPKVQFKFKNTGNAPLIVTNVRPSCGCTTPSWSKEPVPAGGTGFIEAAYNSNAGHGTFTKSITVTTNVPDQTKVLFIKGEVITPLSEDPAKQSPVRIQDK
jgi:hypothetical protein